MCAARDAWSGWDRSRRVANLGFLTNNTRFLVLPFFHRAALGKATCWRLWQDAIAPTGRPSMGIPCMRWKPLWTATVSSEPATGRPTGCSSAKTQGRTRNDRNHCLRATVKDAYLYPFSPGPPAGVVHMIG